MTSQPTSERSPLVDAIVRAVEEDFAKAPPTICLIGLSGVGKSSTMNAMFGTNRTVSGSTRGTHRFNARTFEIVSHRLEGASVTCQLKVYDAPGLGEDVALDDNYIERYRQHLPKCDVALWIVAARNRALALDQQYLSRLADVLPNLVIGINQVDLVDPLTWDERINMPSRAQEPVIAAIVADRQEKLGRLAASRVEAAPAVAYSALRYYNLQALFAACVKAAPPAQRWKFDLLKSFSTRDWLDRAKGLTAEQRSRLAARYIASDAKVRLSQVPKS